MTYRLTLPISAIATTMFIVSSCAESPPADVLDYESCLQMNAAPIAPTHDDDPHLGTKNVYACNATKDALIAGPTAGYPDGTLIVKVSTRETQTFPWLIATMRKQAGAWQWNEYTRNFADEPFAEIPSGPQVCTDCHEQVSAVDWVFTVYQPSEVNE